MHQHSSRRSPHGPATCAALVCFGLLLALPRAGASQEDAAVAGRVSFGGGATPEWMKLSDAVVYLEGEGLPRDSTLLDDDAGRPTLRQKDQTYLPHVIVMMAGTRLRVTNGDTILHNVHTRSKGRRRNPPFNQGQEPGEVLRPRFPAPDSILVLCDIHSQMQAHLFVLPHPFFDKADEEGRFELAHVPPGTYRLVAWSEHFGFREQELTVRAGETTEVTIDFTRGEDG